jgi:hypothetical protein
MRSGASIWLTPWFGGVLRGTLALGLALILLNPACTRRVADPDALAIAVLGQVSPSMLSDDGPAGTRLDFVAHHLEPDNATGALATLSRRYATQALVFATELRHAGDRTTWRIGRAAIGDALAAMLEQPAPAGTAWGAVVLFSDGIQTAGQQPAIAARRLGEAGIPVHVVALGDARRSGSLEARFEQNTVEATVGEVLTVPLVLTNQFAEQRAVVVDLAVNGQPVASLPATLAANARLTVEPRFTPTQAGPAAISATVRDAQAADIRPLAVAHARAAVGGPSTLNVLFIGRPSPTLRALHPVFGVEDRHQLTTWLQLGRERWLLRPAAGSSDAAGTVADEHQTELPAPPAALLAAQLLILDGAVAAHLDAAWLDAIRAFVGTAGGGLLWFGEPPAADHPLAALLPARDVVPFAPRTDSPLLARDGALLTHERIALFSRQPPPFVAGGWVVTSSSRLPAGARPALVLDNGQPVLSYHGYGAGRVAWLGLDHAWMWALGSDSGADQHRQLWLGASQWLAEARRPRIDSPLQGSMLPFHEPPGLRVRLLDRSFAPRADARVRARVTAPSGQSFDYGLVAVYGQPGLYATEFAFSEVGAWQADVQATFADGETLHQTLWFSAYLEGDDSDNWPRESVLRDIARLSGGTYRTAAEYDPAAPLAVSARIPHIAQVWYWARSPRVIGGLLIVACAEWYLRRRRGLI